MSFSAANTFAPTRRFTSYMANEAVKTESYFDAGAATFDAPESPHGLGCRLVEFGSGASTKTRLLLEQLDRLAGYVPIDIAHAQLGESCDKLAMEFPALEIQPICADYTMRFELTHLQCTAEMTMVFFPGSTIGNFEPYDAVDFLAGLAALRGRGGSLLIGVDLKKNPGCAGTGIQRPAGSYRCIQPEPARASEPRGEYGF